MKQRTEQDVFLTLAALCAQGEHCQYEMLEKMRRWEVDETVKARVMQKLVAGRYIDDERFARAFVKDKVRYKLPTTFASECSTRLMMKNICVCCALLFSRNGVLLRLSTTMRRTANLYALR